MKLYRTIRYFRIEEPKVTDIMILMGIEKKNIKIKEMRAVNAGRIKANLESVLI